MYKLRFLPVLLLVIGLAANAQKEITVFANKPGVKISPDMWGIFFEDINLAADGGLYAELVKNRSFEFYNPMAGCSEIKGKDKKGKVLFINRITTKSE
ncbi:MAG: hypothetical protein ACR2KZ_00145 [Segetibacter sp.]